MRDAFPLALWYFILALLIGPALVACARGQATFEITGNWSGTGSHEHSIEAAGQLIESVHDGVANKRAWAIFLLETHGWQTDGKSLMWVNGTEYIVAENGTISEVIK